MLGVSPVFLGIAGATAVCGALLWTNFLPRFVPLLTILFVVGGWVLSLCIHEFGHALVAYLGGDRSVVGAGYLSLNPLRYTNLTMSLVLPIIFLLIGGIALPGGAVYINHSALRTRAWSSAVSVAGPVATALCGLLIVAAFAVATRAGWIVPTCGTAWKSWTRTTARFGQNSTLGRRNISNSSIARRFRSLAF